MKMNSQATLDTCKDCGQSLEDSIWADQGLCQMCWEAECARQFWALDFEAIYTAMEGE